MKRACFWDLFVRYWCTRKWSRERLQDFKPDQCPKCQKGTMEIKKEIPKTGYVYIEIPDSSWAVVCLDRPSRTIIIFLFGWSLKEPEPYAFFLKISENKTNSSQYSPMNSSPFSTNRTILTISLIGHTKNLWNTFCDFSKNPHRYPRLYITLC